MSDLVIIISMAILMTLVLLAFEDIISSNDNQKGKYYMTKKTIIRKFIKTFLLYIIFVLVLNVALIYLDNTNIDPQNKHLYMPIVLGITLLACSIGNEIIDRIEKHLDKIKREK